MRSWLPITMPMLARLAPADRAKARAACVSMRPSEACDQAELPTFFFDTSRIPAFVAPIATNAVFDHVNVNDPVTFDIVLQPHLKPLTSRVPARAHRVRRGRPLFRTQRARSAGARPVRQNGDHPARRPLHLVRAAGRLSRRRRSVHEIERSAPLIALLFSDRAFFARIEPPSIRGMFAIGSSIRTPTGLAGAREWLALRGKVSEEK